MMIATATETLGPAPGGLPLPLTDGERGMLQEEREHLLSLWADIDRQGSRHFALGRFLIKMRDGGALWKRDPQYAHLDFVGYACAITGKDRVTVQRYITVAEKYPEATFTGLWRQGTRFSVLAELQRSEEQVREQILAVATQRKLTMSDLKVAVKTAEKMLRVTAPPTGVDLHAGILDSLDEKKKKKLAKNRRRPGRGKGGPPRPAESADLGDLHGKFVQLQAAHDRMEQEKTQAQQQAALLQQRLEDSERRSQDIARALEQERAERGVQDVAALRQQMEAQQQELQWKLIQVDTDGAAIQRDRAALDADRAALAAERAAFEEARKQAAIEREDQRVALAAEAKRLEQKEEQLDSGLFQLELGQKDLAQQRADLEQIEDRVHDDMTRLVQFAKLDGSLRWPDETWDLRSTLLCIVDHFDQLRRLSGVLDKLLQGKRRGTDTPQAIIDALIEFN